MNLQATVVVNETQLSEPIHKEVNSSSGGTDHFRQSFLAYLRNYVSPHTPGELEPQSTRLNTNCTE